MVQDKVRVSVGTASVLGLLKYRLNVAPTTAYLMTYCEGNCVANCSFCAQARENTSKRSLLSRVMWPAFPLRDVLRRFKNPAMNVLERACIQVINYPGFLEDTLDLARMIKEACGLPVSLDICPVDRGALERLRDAGIERISIPFDGATPEIFDDVKGINVRGPYRWEGHMRALGDALAIFGEGNVMTNLIIGLGETEEEAVGFIQRISDMGVGVGLFAFTPIPHTKLAHLPQPPLETYRRVQVARHLITENISRYESMDFDEDGRLVGVGDVDLAEVLRGGAAFETSGCPGCNRPFYNERPSGPFYNYPRDLSEEEAQREIELTGIE